MAQTAVLLIGHGSRNPDAEAGVYQLAELIRRRLPLVLIEVAFMEVSSPSIEVVCEKLVTKGIERLIALPCMLMSASHVKHDIPEIILRIEKSTPLSVHYIPGLGITDAVIDAAQARIQHELALAGELKKETPKTPLDKTALLVVGSGSTDRGAVDNLNKLLVELLKVVPVAMGEIGFTGVATPNTSSALAGLINKGYSHIVVFPCMLFNGYLSSKVNTACSQVWADNPGITIQIASPFNSHERIVDEFERLVSEGFAHISKELDSAKG